MLRYVTPVMHFRRTATSDMEMRGQQVREGDKIVFWHTSANRDELVFDDPNTFDVTRSPNPHIAFGGGGPHFCLGANLARMEIMVLFDRLLDRIPDIRLNGEVQRLQSNFINGTKHIPGGLRALRTRRGHSASRPGRLRWSPWATAECGSTSRSPSCRRARSCIQPRDCATSWAMAACTCRTTSSTLVGASFRYTYSSPRQQRSRLGRLARHGMAGPDVRHLHARRLDGEPGLHDRYLHRTSGGHPHGRKDRRPRRPCSPTTDCASASGWDGARRSST